MNEKTDFVLVKRPSSALEKVAPGAKRVSTGLVANALALTPSETTSGSTVIFLCNRGNRRQTLTI
jgi:hypothetical protein